MAKEFSNCRIHVYKHSRKRIIARSSTTHTVQPVKRANSTRSAWARVRQLHGHMKNLDRLETSTFYLLTFSPNSMNCFKTMTKIVKWLLIFSAQRYATVEFKVGLSIAPHITVAISLMTNTVHKFRKKAYNELATLMSVQNGNLAMNQR